jgi:hypothetical protein
MGLDLTYDADGATFTHRFSHADWRTIEALRAHLPEQVAVCFDVQELGDPVRVKTTALTHSALDMDRFLADNAQLLPATYQFKLERIPVPGMMVGGFDTGGISGLLVPNEPEHRYWIDAGLNKLIVTKVAVGADGRSVVVEKRDMRNETELITEDAGKVQFRRRAAKTTLRRALRDIAAFTDRVASEEVTKTVG